jgi:homoserine kinase
MDVRRVIVRVPATTANLGSGFDCLGMALELHNTVTAQVLPSGLDVRITGEGEESLRWGEENRVLRAMRLIYQEAGRRLPGLRLDLENAIPLGRGLGSSAAASVGGLVAANTLCENALTNDQLLALAVRLEGHPDNVASARSTSRGSTRRPSRGSFRHRPPGPAGRGHRRPPAPTLPPVHLSGHEGPV